MLQSGSIDSQQMILPLQACYKMKRKRKWGGIRYQFHLMSEIIV